MLDGVVQRELLPEKSCGINSSNDELSCSPSHSTTASGEASPGSVGSPSPSDNDESSILLPKARGKLWCTDAEISGYEERDEERPLKQWKPSADDSGCADERELEEDMMLKDGMRNEEAWDQFQANAELFGVVSSFKTDLSQYTTALDVSKVPQAVRVKAERLAQEIERGKHSKNMCDETGCSDGDDDEEARWSAVPRALCSKATLASLRLVEKMEDASKYASPSAEQASEQQVKRGTYLHVDGLGIIDQRIAQSMPGAFGQYVNTASAGNLLLGTSPMNASLLSDVPMTPNCIHPGSHVVIEGLLKAPAFNGRYGIVQSFDAQTGRYNIMLQGGPYPNQLAKVKIENLRWATPESKGDIYQ